MIKNSSLLGKVSTATMGGSGIHSTDDPVGGCDPTTNFRPITCP